MKLSQWIKGFGFAVMMTLATSGQAADWQAYSDEAFKSAQDRGSTIVVDFHADWCSTCKKQKPILESLLKQEEFKNVVGLTANFDSAAELKKKYQVQKQSTLIVFKGAKEVSRSMGSTNESDIRATISKGL